MTDRILEILNNLLKITKEQIFLKSELLRSKVPIKPLLGLTGLGVLLMAVRPLLRSNHVNDDQIKTSIAASEKQEGQPKYTLQKTLYLMQEKEKQLKQEAATQKS